MDPSEWTKIDATKLISAEELARKFPQQHNQQTAFFLDGTGGVTESAEETYKGYVAQIRQGQAQREDEEGAATVEQIAREIEMRTKHAKRTVADKTEMLYKMAVVGCKAVGKSSLVRLFLYGSVIDGFKPRNNRYHGKKKVNGKEGVVDIQEARRPSDSLITEYEGFICVFSVTSSDSFNAISDYRDQIMRVNNSDVPIVLVGNKCDLPTQRKVSFEMGRRRADEWGVQYVETSVNRRENVKKMFYDMMRELRRQKNVGQSSIGSGATPMSLASQAIGNQ